MRNLVLALPGLEASRGRALCLFSARLSCPPHSFYVCFRWYGVAGNPFLHCLMLSIGDLLLNFFGGVNVALRPLPLVYCNGYAPLKQSTFPDLLLKCTTLEVVFE